MRTKARTVWEDWGQGIATLEGGPQVDSAAWFAWLEDPATRSFAYPITNAAQGYIEAFLTVRKEQRQRGAPIGRPTRTWAAGCARPTWGARQP